MEKRLIIRNAEEKDLEQLSGLLDQLKPGNAEKVHDMQKIREAFLKIKKDGNYYLKVCEIDGRITGTATLLIQDNITHGARPYGHIENVVTDKDYRGLGIGNKIIESLVQDAKGRNCYKIILDCNETLIRFYEKAGFHNTGSVEMRLDLK
ncbi:GNAT family N-acetyltransferase [Candidatus Parvarchaeota archaeon]|nr:GNAT family N-acetyltransferase [Candidatus Parvarchaeota archaeon]